MGALTSAVDAIAGTFPHLSNAGINPVLFWGGIGLAFLGALAGGLLGD